MKNRTAFSKASVVLVSLIAFDMAIAQSLPVIPGATGFGITTPAGRGGEVYRVTNLGDSGTGSLRACMEASGPRVCIFEIAGAINLSDRIRVRDPYLTVAGQTAPSPGIELRNSGILITASDVLIQHIRIRVGDDPSGPDYENRDALQIEGSNGNLTQNVVIDHSSFSYAIDETLTLYFDWDNVTLRNNIFSEPLHDSFHPNTAPPGNGVGHGKGVLTNDSTAPGRVAIVGNLIAHSIERNPKTLASDVVLVNNVIYNGVERNAHLTTNGSTTRHSVVGNVFIDGPDSDRWVRTIHLTGLVAGSQVYLYDNVAPELSGGDQWTIVTNNSSLSRQSLEAGAPPVWVSGLSALPTSGDTALDWVLENAGARPAERDTADIRVINHVRNGSGQYINCVSADGSERCSRNAGGWSVLPETRRALELPANPGADDDSDGYTNLEEWLHGMAEELENGDVVRPAAPVSLSAS